MKKLLEAFSAAACFIVTLPALPFREVQVTSLSSDLQETWALLLCFWRMASY